MEPNNPRHVQVVARELDVRCQSPSLTCFGIVDISTCCTASEVPRAMSVADDDFVVISHSQPSTGREYAIKHTDRASGCSLNENR
jgi:hypothetical protein